MSNDNKFTLIPSGKQVNFGDPYPYCFKPCEDITLKELASVLDGWLRFSEEAYNRLSESSKRHFERKENN